MNWYVTFYLIFYSIYPFLNTVINKLTQRQHLAYICVFFIIYFCICSIKKDVLFANRLISYTEVYFIVAYIKKYNLQFASNKKINIAFMLTGIIMLFLLQFAVNFVGLKIDAIGSRIYYLVTNNNPLILLIGFSVFNIFRDMKFQSKFVNYISSLTILIYITHDNIIFREYVRPIIMYDFWIASGKMNIILLILICSVILFIISTLIAILYNKLLQPLVHKLAEKILNIILKLYDKFEIFIFKIQ